MTLGGRPVLYHGGSAVDTTEAERNFPGMTYEAARDGESRDKNT